MPKSISGVDYSAIESVARRYEIDVDDEGASAYLEAARDQAAQFNVLDSVKGVLEFFDGDLVEVVHRLMRKSTAKSSNGYYIYTTAAKYAGEPASGRSTAEFTLPPIVFGSKKTIANGKRRIG